MFVVVVVPMVMPCKLKGLLINLQMNMVYYYYVRGARATCVRARRQEKPCHWPPQPPNFQGMRLGTEPTKKPQGSLFFFATI